MTACASGIAVSYPTQHDRVLAHRGRAAVGVDLKLEAWNIPSEYYRYIQSLWSVHLRQWSGELAPRGGSQPEWLSEVRWICGSCMGRLNATSHGCEYRRQQQLRAQLHAPSAAAKVICFKPCVASASATT